MKPSEKLLERLRLVIHIPPGVRFRRLYPGYWQRSAGAWVWAIESRNGFEIGSSERVSEFLKADGIAFGFDGEILPVYRERACGDEFWFQKEEDAT